MSLRKLISWLFSALRHGAPLVMLIACAFVLWPEVQALDTDQLKQSWAAISPQKWGLALVFTAISFWAVGQYDVIAHRQLDTGVPPHVASHSGMTAIAISQTLGFGVITASLARWRMLRGFGPGTAALVTGFVSLSFMVATIGLTSLACLFLPAPTWIKPLAALALVAVMLLCAASIVYRRVRLRGLSIDLPGVRAMRAAGGWAFVDIFAAGLALWILIPADAQPGLLSFFAVFCVALTLGLVSGTPGGAGPFELALLSLTATGTAAETPQTALLVAVMGFRLVYFALPAALAATRLLIRPHPIAVWRDPVPPEMTRLPRAETGVLRQNGGYIDHVADNALGIWETSQVLVGLFDPMARPGEVTFDHFHRKARNRNRFAVLYKSSAQTAALARRAGWHVVHMADDATLNLASYTLNIPERAGLRRKLRKAERCGVTIRASEPHDTLRMAELDHTWQQRHGRARGGTMGQYCPDYVRGQVSFVAEQSGKVIAFISLHANPREWTLDLMRHEDDLPDGTMHALTHQAAIVAQARCIPTLCLSAVPACPAPESAFWRSVSLRAVAWSRSAGLRQFKSSFAPRWTPLYIAAPSRFALCVGAMDIAHEVFRPRPIAKPTTDEVNALHKQDENYEIASTAAA